MLDLRPYQQSVDSAAVYALWQAAVGQQWPMTAADFHRLLTESPVYQDGDCIVACHRERIVGFVAAQIDRSNPEWSSIAALLVDPQFQRRGIGTALHAAALAHLQANGAAKVQLGAGGYSYFWPGVPTNLPAARAFFEARGWVFDETCHDLAQNMQEYHPPDDPAIDVLIELATSEDATALLEFERREFPHWLGPFQWNIDRGDFHELLLARDPASRTIVGTLIVYSPLAHPSSFDGFWKMILGDPLGEIGCVGVAEALHGRGIGSAMVSRVGEIGCVGVAEALHGRGIGSAMVSRASEILKQRGVASVHIGWVSRVNFYSRLGYALWRSYDMSWRKLAS